MAKKKPIDQAFDLVSDYSISDLELMDRVDALYKEADEFDQLMFGAVYEAIIVAGRDPDHQ